MDVLPLYIVLMLASPILFAGICAPAISLCSPPSPSILLRGNSAGIFRPIRAEAWYFNPFAWQLPVRDRRLVRRGRRGDLLPFIRSRAAPGPRRGLSGVRLRDGRGRPASGPPVIFPPGFVGTLQSQRQDQPCPLSFPPLHCHRISCHSVLSPRLAGSRVARFQARHSLRTAVAGSLLRRNLPVVRRALRAGGGVGRDLDADRRQCGRRRLVDAAAWYRSWTKKVDRAPRQAAPPN